MARKRSELPFGGVTHPTTIARMKDAAKRLDKLQEQCKQARDLLWTAMLTTNFTPFELGLLRKLSRLSQYDEWLLKRVKSGADDADPTA
jgi:hypothetical protein